MKKEESPSAEIRYEGNLFAIENFELNKEEAENGNSYNTFFQVRVHSGFFSGCSKFEYDIKKFVNFVDEMAELYLFKRDTVELNDICYGSSVSFRSDKIGHLEISGEIYDYAMVQSLKFTFRADQTCLPDFIKVIKKYVECQ